FERFHELVVREGGSRAAGAWGPGPEHERIGLHVLDNLLCRVAASVACGIFHLLADLLRATSFPEHRQWREVPIRNTRHEAVRRIRCLMTCLTLLGGCAVAVLSADDERQMNSAGIALPRRLVLMAVDASWVHEDAGDGIERRPGGCLGRLAVIGSK